jgi:DNA polymerase I-like protein with 3'-5' exonuclease and polymerase domains
MLRELFNDHGLVLRWPWEKVEDTLISAHLLGSNHKKDLTTQALIYLDEDIKPLEDRLREVVNKARRIARKEHKDWVLAKKGHPLMPSVKGDKDSSYWSFDMWLPKALDMPEVDALPEYSNGDSSVTLPLHDRHLALIEQRGLMKLYRERLKLIEIAAEMEQTGITASRSRLYEQRDLYQGASAIAAKQLRRVANKHNYDLVLPKSGNNKSLTSFVFDRLKLPRVKVSDKTGAPSLDKEVLEQYVATLEPGEVLDFMSTLRSKRSRDTAVTYLDGYERFWRPLYEAKALHRVKAGKDWFLLHPSLNITGTDTLRWSSQNPNSQNISKKEDVNLRLCFGPAPGRVWYSMDAKNLELRIPAYKAEDRVMLELFERANEPPFYGSNHLLNFSIVYPDIWRKEVLEVGLEEVGPHCKKKYAATWYQWCKNGGFAKQYGGQRKKVDATFHKAGAYQLLESRFVGLSKLNAACIATAKRTGYIETLPDRTVDPERGYPLLCIGGKYRHGVSPTIPLNYMVQGTACWLIARAMVKCQAYLKTIDDSYMIAQIHDELVFDMPADRDNTPHIRQLKLLIESCGQDLVPSIPTPVGVERHIETLAVGETLAV